MLRYVPRLKFLEALYARKPRQGGGGCGCVPALPVFAHQLSAAPACYVAVLAKDSVSIDGWRGMNRFVVITRFCMTAVQVVKKVYSGSGYDDST